MRVVFCGTLAMRNVCIAYAMPMQHVGVIPCEPLRLLL